MFGFSTITSAGSVYPQCYPTHAVEPVTGQQTDWAELGEWPQTFTAECLDRCVHKSKCRTPSTKPTGNPSDPFPVYYMIRKCNDAEIRVQYNLFYEKDGFYPEVSDNNKAGNGHP